MKDNKHLLGLLFTALFHAFIVAAFAAGFGGGNDTVAEEFKEAQTIEASLAFKKVEQKSRLPQKQKKKTFKQPEPENVSKDLDAKPEKQKDEKKPVKQDEFDPDSILTKNRIQDSDLSNSGVEEVPRDGQTDGSEWGTESQARGHEYVAQLKSNIYSVWEYPSISSNKGLAEGCVKLNAKGKIIKPFVKEGSNKDLNLSVRNALRKAPDMEEPVPQELRSLLLKTGVCFSMSPGDR